MRLDKRDRALLQLLYEDSRTPNSELAERVGMSASACWRRIKALEESGVINRYGVVVDEAKVGMQFRAMVDVRLSRHDPQSGKKFEHAMIDCEEIVECYATTGREDYSLYVVCEDIQAYNHFLDSFLFKLGSVQSVQTNVILRDIKRHSLRV